MRTTVANDEPNAGTAFLPLLTRSLAERVAMRVDDIPAARLPLVFAELRAAGAAAGAEIFMPPCDYNSLHDTYTLTFHAR